MSHDPQRARASSDARLQSASLATSAHRASHVRELAPSHARVDALAAAPDEAEWDTSFLDELPPHTTSTSPVTAGPLPSPAASAGGTLARLDGDATAATPAGAPHAEVAARPPSKADEGECEPLAQFTRAFVASMNRTTYYMPGHPAHVSVPRELFDALRALLSARSQIGYVLQREAPAAVYVDGLSTGRARLDEAMPEAAYEVFMPKFMEYLSRSDLVSMTFRAGITFDEFDAFVSLMTRPAIARDADRSLADEMRDARVTHVAVLSGADLADLDADLPLLVRVCIARLRRDLHAVAAQGGDPSAVERAARRALADAAAELTDAGQVLRVILSAQRIERHLHDAPSLRSVRVAPGLVAALPLRGLVELSGLLVRSWVDAVRRRDPSLPALRDAALACAARLRGEGAAGAQALKALEDNGLLGYDQLPDWLQDDVHAEQVYAAAARGERAGVASTTARDLGVIGKATRRLLDEHQTAQAVALLRFLVGRLLGESPELAAAARAALAAAVPPSSLPELAAWLSGAQGEEASVVAALFGALGERGAAAVCAHVAQSPASLRAQGIVEAITRAGPAASTPLAALMSAPELPPATLRAAITLAARHPSQRTFEALTAMAAHPQPTLRMAALAALRDAHGAHARPALEAALRDPDGNVVVFAMSTLAERYGAGESVRAHALQRLREAAPGTPSALLLSAMKLLDGATGATRAAYLEALERLLKVHARETSVVRLGTGKGFAPELIDAARAALARRDDASGWQRLRAALR